MAHNPRNPPVLRGTTIPTYGDSPASGPAPHTAGHHRHDLLNKLDPSVDSSRDKVPLPPPGTATNGPHSSRLANKLDPTVDTRAYEGASLGGTGGAGGGMMGGQHGGGAPEGTYGPHPSRVANAADPRVDSDRDGRGPGAMHAAGAGGAGFGYGHPQPEGGIVGQQQGVGYGQQEYGAGHGQQHGHASTLPGPAPNTAGPHRSDMMNKLDPTVDSKGGMNTERGQRRGI